MEAEQQYEGNRGTKVYSKSAYGYCRRAAESSLTGITSFDAHQDNHFPLYLKDIALILGGRPKFREFSLQPPPNLRERRKTYLSGDATDGHIPEKDEGEAFRRVGENPLTQEPPCLVSRMNPRLKKSCYLPWVPSELNMRFEELQPLSAPPSFNPRNCRLRLSATVRCSCAPYC